MTMTAGAKASTEGMAVAAISILKIKTCIPDSLSTKVQKKLVEYRIDENCCHTFLQLLFFRTNIIPDHDGTWHTVYHIPLDNKNFFILLLEIECLQ
jgi:hypothetical protein